jgi:hypothetical protein
MKLLLPNELFRSLRLLGASVLAAWLFRLTGAPPATTPLQFFIDLTVCLSAFLGIATIFQFLDSVYLRHLLTKHR